MKKAIIILISLFNILFVYGQVESRLFPNHNALDKISMAKNINRSPKIKKMPSFNKQVLLDEDVANEGLDIPFRFGKGFDTNITLSDGNWTEVENGRLWSMEFESQGAYSINFVFNDFYLPEGAELYITNKDETMLYGPVTSEQNTKNGFFLTDFIEGDNVTIYLFEPTDKRGLAKLTVKRVIHAYKNLFADFSYGNYGNSESCNNNIDDFPAWDLESDAVALVLLQDGTELCSGSLLMTANQSFKSFFLSAFHCVDTDENGSLSASEISSAENWMFKFKYKRSTYTGNSRTSGITYNGAAFRAAWKNSDFALMEINASLVGDNRFSCLGWDRSGNTPTSGTCIHHPAGDVMKISFENHPFQFSSWGGANNHWLVNFDNGVVQHGSSGSPIFNQDKRVVGQLHGNQNYDPNKSYCSQPRAEYGRFDLSWTGGGTNDTRLSNWIDPTGSGSMTTNTIRFPYIDGPINLCPYTNITYTVVGNPGNYPVTWSVSSPSIFTLISASGNSASFRMTGVTPSTETISAFYNNVRIQLSQASSSRMSKGFEI